MLTPISKGLLFRCILILCAIGVGFVYFKSSLLTEWSAQSIPSPFVFLNINENSEAQNAKSNKQDFYFNYDITQNETQILSMIDDIVASDTSGKERSRFQELGNITCSGAPKFHGVEDLLCEKPPKILPDYKNPCWKQNGRFVCLPRFRLIGVSKSGTTDLFARILEHPDIIHNDVGNKKETFWWSCKRYGHLRNKNKRPIEDFNRYLEYFATAASTIQRNNNSHMITGDGTPRDLYCMDGWVLIPQNQGLKEPNFLTPHLIRHINPDVKLMVIMRDPIERAYTNYYSLKGKYSNLGSAGFDKAIRSAIPILHKCTRFSSLRSCLYNRTVKLAFWKLTGFNQTVLRQERNDKYFIVCIPLKIHQIHPPTKARIHIGFYSVYMRDWLNAFPREQFLLLQSEELHDEVGKYMQQIFQFVGVRNLSRSELDSIVNIQPIRATKGKKDKGPMLEKTRLLLKRLYQPFNIELANLANDNRFLWT